MAALYSTSYEDRAFYQVGKLRRDHVATVLAAGSGRQKHLFVNGITMTNLTPITKIMAHLPLASRDRKPESALVICFGMGTTVRSLSRWDIDITAVELVPSVPDVFDYFFKDAGDVLKNPKVHVVIDDGRRFLRRTEKKFDLITIDPPPPVEAAGSSLLVLPRVLPPHQDAAEGRRHPADVVPRRRKTYVRGDGAGDRQRVPVCAHLPLDRELGLPFLRLHAADRKAQRRRFHCANARRRARGHAGMGGWTVLGRRTSAPSWNAEVPLQDALNPDLRVCVTDDQPYNEYFLLRRTWNKLNGKHASVH